jgi:glycosyltransferase involved in cell wall biosynthesis
MKIGLVTKWLDESFTGIGVYLLNLAKNMVALGREHEFTFIHKQGGDNELYRHGEELFLPKFSPGPLWILDANLYLARKRGVFDLVHEPYLGLFCNGDFKKVVTIHDLTPRLTNLGHLTFRVYFRTVMKSVLKKADAVITVSENTKQDVVRHYKVDEEKVFRVYNGVTHEPADGKDIESVRGNLGLGDHPYILTVGSLIPIKNLSTAIKAFAEAREKKDSKCRDHRLVLAGKKDIDYPALQKLVDRLGLGKQIIFTDYIQWQDINSLYAGADLLLFPSHYEGFGFPPLEAMHHGVPVIASDRASIPEVVGDAGVLHDPGDTGSWALSINEILGDDARRNEMVDAGRERVKKFTWERAARETLEVYEKVSGA